MCIKKVTLTVSLRVDKANKNKKKNPDWDRLMGENFIPVGYYKKKLRKYPLHSIGIGLLFSNGLRVARLCLRPYLFVLL